MIAGCNALVTGGSSGIGAAIAEGLAAAGCAVTVLGRDRTRLAEFAHRLGACALVADLSTAEGLSQAVDAVKGVDLLVNSAGRGWAGDLAAMAPTDIDALIADQLAANRDQPALTADRVKIELLANINNLSDARAAGAMGAAPGAHWCSVPPETKIAGSLVMEAITAPSAALACRS